MLPAMVFVSGLFTPGALLNANPTVATVAPLASNAVMPLPANVGSWIVAVTESTGFEKVIVMSPEAPVPGSLWNVPNASPGAKGVDRVPDGAAFPALPGEGACCNTRRGCGGYRPPGRHMSPRPLRALDPRRRAQHQSHRAGHLTGHLPREGVPHRDGVGPGETIDRRPVAELPQHERPSERADGYAEPRRATSHE